MTISYWIASGLGVGRCPIAPGTAASLAAALIGAATIWIDPRLLIWLAIAATVVGFLAIQAVRPTDDPGWIVIDEFAGQWVAMLGLAQFSWPGVIASFVLFRFFDIVKPGPVGWADRHHNATGIMADDVVAGLIVAAILFVATNLYPNINP